MSKRLKALCKYTHTHTSNFLLEAKRGVAIC